MSYRDDRDALTSYHADLVRTLSRLEAQAAELTRVEAERARVAAELARVRLDLEHRRGPLRLDTLRIAAPCNVPWDAMRGDDRARDCARCDQTVYNLSALSRDEAEAFLAARGASSCVRLFRRADGTILTADCPVGIRRRHRRLAIAAGALAGVAAGAAVGLHRREVGVVPGGQHSERHVVEGRAFDPPRRDDPDRVPVEQQRRHHPRRVRPLSARILRVDRSLDRAEVEIGHQVEDEVRRCPSGSHSAGDGTRNDWLGVHGR